MTTPEFKVKLRFMGLAFVMGLFFIFLFVAFVIVAIFLPEWVGITGNKAREIMSEQQDEQKPPPP